MPEFIKYQFPILTINRVNPLLSKEDRVFAHAITATTEDGVKLTLYENNGLDLCGYIGQKMECLLEITQGEFEDKDQEGKLHGDTLVFQFLWHKRLSEYFPELMKIKNELDDADDEEEYFMQALFEATAIRLFKDWGLNGLNIGIYQAKPLLSNTNGFFLINEFQFEEEIEELELNEEVYIKIDEIFLRGIRPCILPVDTKQKQIFVQQKKQENIIKPKPQEEPKETKKNRSGFFLD